TGLGGLGDGDVGQEANDHRRPDDEHIAVAAVGLYSSSEAPNAVPRLRGAPGAIAGLLANLATCDRAAFAQHAVKRCSLVIIHKVAAALGEDRARSQRESHN